MVVPLCLQARLSSREREKRQQGRRAREAYGVDGQWICACMCAQVLRHDIGEKRKVGTISEAYPHLVIDNFSSRLGERVGNILKYLFPCPKARALCCPAPLLSQAAARPVAGQCCVKF